MKQVYRKYLLPIVIAENEIKIHMGYDSMLELSKDIRQKSSPIYFLIKDYLEFMNDISTDQNFNLFTVEVRAKDFKLLGLRYRWIVSNEVLS